jgi:hypothetical protein
MFLANYKSSAEPACAQDPQSRRPQTFRRIASENYGKLVVFLALSSFMEYRTEFACLASRSAPSQTDLRWEIEGIGLR